MGGHFSTRWNFEPVRTETDLLPSLDVRWLGRIGALAPGAVCCPQWTCRGETSGSIMTVCAPHHNCLILDYSTHAPGSEGESVREAIDLATTRCHYGGERTWFLCLGCRRRRAVLFALDGRFRCRACHRLAYSSTREDTAARSHRRLAVLRSKLGGGHAPPVWTIPPRPKGMHHRTYDRLVRQIARELTGHDALPDAFVTKPENPTPSPRLAVSKKPV